MSNQTLLIATSNPGKFHEIKDFLQDLDFTFLSLQELNINADYPETGSTFEENAIGKAKYYFQKSGMLTLAEDSGIIVDALKGEFGVKTRRFGKGENASDQEWVEHFLEIMKVVPEEKRTARFICTAALIGENIQQTFTGETTGLITRNLEAPIKTGLPLSSCFKPFGQNKVYAALSMEEKNMISHRGKAIAAVKEFFKAR